MNYIDTHFHLDLHKSPKTLLKTLEIERIYTIAVTNAPSVYHYTSNLLANSKYVKAALGFHPELVAERIKELPLFFDHLNTTRYIGEVGLDYSNNNQKEQILQRNVFEQIVEKCNHERNKILTIHSRRAESDVINILGKSFKSKAILHWYSGSLKNLSKAIEYGFYFSVNDAMTRSKKGIEIISSIPKSRILTESDGPFVKENNKPLSPLNIQNTIAKISKILNEDPYQIKCQVYNNMKDILLEKL